MSYLKLGILFLFSLVFILSCTLKDDLDDGEDSEEATEESSSGTTRKTYYEHLPLPSYSQAPLITYEKVDSFDNSNRNGGAVYNSYQSPLTAIASNNNNYTNLFNNETSRSWTEELCKDESLMVPDKYHLKHVKGRAVALTPIEGGAELAELVAEDIALALNDIGKYLGIEIPIPCFILRLTIMGGEKVTRYLKMVGEPPYASVTSVGLSEPGDIGGGATVYTEIDSLKKYHQEGKSQYFSKVAAAVVRVLALPTTLQSGLSLYLDDPSRARVKSFWQFDRMCQGENVALWTSQGDKLTSIKYTMEYGLNRGFAGACFWYWIEKRYGHGIFQDIMKRVVKRSGLPVNMIEGVLTPVLPDDISDIILSVWGIGIAPELYRAKNYDPISIKEDGWDDTEKEKTCQNDATLEPGAGEIKVVNGRAVAILPSKYQATAKNYVASDDLSFKRLRRYMGTELYTDCVVHTTKFDEKRVAYFGGFYKGSFNDTPTALQIVTQGPEEMLDGFNDHFKLAPLSTTHGVAGNVHEMTHAMQFGMNVPAWLNEGLATYLEDDERTGTFIDFDSNVLCLDTRMNVTNYEAYPTRVIIEGYDLTKDPYDIAYIDVPGIYFYYWGGCFWKWIEEKYGHGNFQRIMARLIEVGWNEEYDFFEDVIYHVLGEDLTDFIKPRWGYYPRYVNVYDESTIDEVRKKLNHGL